MLPLFPWPSDVENPARPNSPSGCVERITKPVLTADFGARREPCSPLTKGRPSTFESYGKPQHSKRFAWFDAPRDRSTPLAP
jgi:hypothetical protein